jgi:hypothetical protein
MLAIERAAKESSDRSALWGMVVAELGAVSVAEIGVWKGEFAEQLLRCCPAIRTYYMLDPWRSLLIGTNRSTRPLQEYRKHSRHRN